MTCRDEIIAAFREMEKATGRQEFTVIEVLAHMRQAGTTFVEPNIRTHMTSRMCVNAPDRNAVTDPDLYRSSPGRYRLHRR